MACILDGVSNERGFLFHPFDGEKKVYRRFGWRLRGIGVVHDCVLPEYAIHGLAVVWGNKLRRAFLIGGHCSHRLRD